MNPDPHRHTSSPSRVRPLQTDAMDIDPRGTTTPRPFSTPGSPRDQSRVFVWLGNDGIYLALLLINDSAFVLSKVGWLREGFFLFFQLAFLCCAPPTSPASAREYDGFTCTAVEFSDISLMSDLLLRGSPHICCRRIVNFCMAGGLTWSVG